MSLLIFLVRPIWHVVFLEMGLVQDISVVKNVQLSHRNMDDLRCVRERRCWDTVAVSGCVKPWAIVQTPRPAPPMQGAALTPGQLSVPREVFLHQGPSAAREQACWLWARCRRDSSEMLGLVQC